MWFGYDNNKETKSNSGEAAWAWKQFMVQIEDEFPQQPFPAKPILKRPFQPSGKAKPKKTDKKVPYRGYDYETKPVYTAQAGSPTHRWLLRLSLSLTRSLSPSHFLTKVQALQLHRKHQVSLRRR